MGPKTLVTKEQVLSGAELIRRLPAGGVEVTGAAWVQTDDDGQPYLYIVTPTYDSAGPLEAIGRVGRVQDDVNAGTSDPFSQLDPFEVKVLSPREPVAQGLARYYQKHSGDRFPWHAGGVLGSVFIDAAYIYPATMFAAATSPSGS